MIVWGAYAFADSVIALWAAITGNADNDDRWLVGLQGIIGVVAGVRLRKEIAGEFWLGLSGVVSILFAFFVIARPGEGALAVIWIIGSYSIIFGIILTAFAFRVRRAANN